MVVGSIYKRQALLILRRLQQNHEKSFEALQPYFCTVTVSWLQCLISMLSSCDLIGLNKHHNAIMDARKHTNTLVSKTRWVFVTLKSRHSMEEFFCYNLYCCRYPCHCTEVRFASFLTGGLNIIIKHSSKSIKVIMLFFCQNDPLMGESLHGKRTAS